MKLKHLPADFFVEERIAYPLKSSGEFTLYRARKVGISTAELIRRLSKWIGVPERYLVHGGLKDSRAETVQHISLKGRGPEFIETEAFSVRRIGFGDQKLSSSHLTGNRFKLILRDLSLRECEALSQNLHLVKTVGFPNYFDDQRFRSQPFSRDIFGFLLFRKDFERALKTYFTEVLPTYGQIGRHFKELVLQQWGNWSQLVKQTRSREWRNIFAHLVKHPADFQGAIFKIPYDDLRMMISATQSYLWNEVLAALVRNACRGNQVETQGAWQAYALFPQDVDKSCKCSVLQELTIPMPHSDWQHTREDLRRELETVLAAHNLSPELLNVPRLRKIHLESHVRKALIQPSGLHLSLPESDEIFQGKRRMKLEFILPPGSYATMLVKQLVVGVEAKEEDRE